MMQSALRRFGVAILFSLTLMASEANAGVSPLGLSLVAPVQFPPENFTVAGARVNAIYGNHFKVYGIDLGGIGNATSQDIGGIQVAGVFNSNSGTSHIVGAQIAGIGNWNVNKMNVIGVQLAGLVNDDRAESFALGVVAAAANLTEHTEVAGVEVGLYNIAREVYGFQIGVVNKVDSLHGLQIGLINFHNKGLFAISPILNFGF